MKDPAPIPTTIPRSVRRGPPITLTCECGETRYLRYGDRWSCERCSRTWDTAKIPVDQYAAIRRTQLRFRRVPIAISVLALATVVVCIVVGKALGGLLVVAILATTWSMFFRPLHRRRYREALAQLPTWQIDPD
jgi:Flp pilus assembly protein TadB